MSLSKYERGRFIKSRINQTILLALGREEIDSVEASRMFDLMSEIETAGTTHDKNLVAEPFYLNAIDGWRTALERKSKDRLIPKLRKSLKFILETKIKELNNAERNL